MVGVVIGIAIPQMRMVKQDDTREQTWIEYGYNEAVQDISNGTPVIGDDIVIITVLKTGDPNKVYLVKLKNPDWTGTGGIE